jgi:heat shock protein HslJ
VAHRFGAANKLGGKNPLSGAQYFFGSMASTMLACSTVEKRRFSAAQSS